MKIVHKKQSAGERTINTTRLIGGMLGLTAACLLLSACVIRDLKQNITELEDNYGVFKGRVNGGDRETDIVFYIRNEESGELASVRTVRQGEPVYALLPRADYYAVAFEDKNGDFAYQSGEAASRIDDPFISWFDELEIDGQVDFSSLPTQEFDLDAQTVLPDAPDLSLDALNTENFLRVVTWDDPSFSADKIEMGMWRPEEFIREVEFGLYALEEFDPSKDKDVILFVHGINDSPKVFRELSDVIPDDYQQLFFHYPSSSSLRWTSYILSVAINEVVKRYDVAQLDVIAHSMGGLVSKGMIYQAHQAQASPDVRERLRLFISIASPFGGHAGAAAGVKWAPVKAPVWFGMAPDSRYLQKVDSLDLTNGPMHHMFYTYSHERGGERQDDDTVVSVESQLAESARRNAAAIYPIADSHVGVMSNDCALRMVRAILENGEVAETLPDC